MFRIIGIPTCHVYLIPLTSFALCIILNAVAEQIHLSLYFYSHERQCVLYILLMI